MALHQQRTFITKPGAIVVYHVHRQVRLDVSQAELPQIAAASEPREPSAVPNLFAALDAEQLKPPPLITPDELEEFYNGKAVKNFHMAGRNLEIHDDPVWLFESEQKDINPKVHSIYERKIRESLDAQIREKMEWMKPEKLAANPIVFPLNNVKETTIFFNSRFESGNLREVEKISEFEYNLFVNFDFNSSVHS